MNRLIVSLAGLGAFLALTAPGSSDTMARVSGKVTDGTTNAPIAAATMSIRDSGGHTVKVTTDRSGRYTAIGFEPGNVTVSFEASGFVPQGRSCRVPPGETGRFDFRAFSHYTNLKRVTYRCDVEPSTVDRTIIH